jgi:hypothetical protein
MTRIAYRHQAAGVLPTRWALSLCAISGLLIMVAGCGATNTGSVQPSSDDVGNLRGIAVAAPQCPVETVGHPCPPKPVAVEITVTDTAGTVVTTFRSGADGGFTVRLPPGTYTLTSRQPRAPYLTPVTVQVSAGRDTELRLLLDTGIR